MYVFHTCSSGSYLSVQLRRTPKEAFRDTLRQIIKSADGLLGDTSVLLYSTYFLPISFPSKVVMQDVSSCVIQHKAGVLQIHIIDEVHCCFDGYLLRRKGLWF